MRAETQSGCSILYCTMLVVCATTPTKVHFCPIFFHFPFEWELLGGSKWSGHPGVLWLGLHGAFPQAFLIGKINLF